MWQRILRLLSTGLSAYSFYSNPIRFLVSLLCAILIPYLAYIFWGSIIILGLIILGIYLLYKAIATNSKQYNHY
jgi:multisubunit Na+/H+ antiporter MnhB subunit